MKKIIFFLLSFIFLISGGYFYINYDVKKDVIFSNEEANMVSKGILPMKVEEAGVKIIYNNPNIEFLNDNVLINLNFEIKGFSLVFNGSANFNSNLILKDNKIYFSELKYKDFNLTNKIEKSQFSEVFVKKYNELIKNKTIEELNIVLNRKEIYYPNENNFINNFRLNESHLVINTSIYNKNYKIYYIICFISSLFLFFGSFFINNKIKKVEE